MIKHYGTISIRAWTLGCCVKQQYDVDLSILLLAQQVLSGF